MFLFYTEHALIEVSVLGSHLQKVFSLGSCHSDYSLTIGRNDILIVALTCCRIGDFHSDVSYILYKINMY